MISVNHDLSGDQQRRELGRLLRLARLARNDKQVSAAARVGVSVPTYRKLESGDPGVTIGVWIRAVMIYGNPNAIEDLIPLSLFDMDAKRQRARRS